MCRGHQQGGALGTELLQDWQPKGAQLTECHMQLMPGAQWGLLLLTNR